jgi:phosphopantetheine adenylyltransferase
MNSLNEVDKAMVKKTIVVYAGRFQPFHKGHYAAYSKLVSKFGSDSVYIGTSNDQSNEKSPFNFREKKEIATKMFGVPSSKFVQIKNPYKPIEILKKFDGQTTQYIAAVGDKDATRLQGNYFKAYKDKAGYGYDEIGYVYPVPAESNPISGTDVRNGLGSGDIEKAKKFFLKAYPKFDKDIFKLITGKLMKENFPAGVGVGLTLPGGYINGAPKQKDVDKLSKTIHTKDDKDTNKDYLYDPIGEIICGFLAEEIFNEFVENYLGEAPNAALDKDISYTNSKNQVRKINN